MRSLIRAVWSFSTVPGFGTDREALRQSAVIFRAAFPDWRSELESLVAEGDLVVEKFTARGTHTGDVFGVAPTGREIRLRGINIFRIANGVITDRWGRLDELGFLHQLGLIPQPAQAYETASEPRSAAAVWRRPALATVRHEELGE